MTDGRTDRPTNRTSVLSFLAGNYYMVVFPMSTVTFNSYRNFDAIQRFYFQYFAFCILFTCLICILLQNSFVFIYPPKSTPFSKIRWKRSKFFIKFEIMIDIFKAGQGLNLPPTLDISGSKNHSKDFHSSFTKYKQSNTV